MSRGFEGVRPASESSIEIGFLFEGRHCIQRLRLKPTAANLKKAKQQREAILQAIAKGEFSWPPG